MKYIQATVMTSLCALLLGGCTMQAGTSSTAADASNKQSEAASKQSSVAAKNQSAEQAQPGVASASVDAAAKLVFQLEGQGLQTPEAVIYDAEQDIYLVSNVNGDPLAVDGNGFISKVSPEGKILELKFIDGSQAKVTLDAPKGMAISGDILYVTDITWIRLFDRKTGAPKGKLFAKGATFLNDITVDKDGVVYVTDTGWKKGAKGFEGTGSDTVYKIDPKKVATEPMLSDKSLGNPNGLVVARDGLWGVNDSGELFHLSSDGKKEKAMKLAKGGLDGVVALDDGNFLVSSWEGEAIYYGKPGETFVPVIAELPSPASIGYDSKRQVLLVPSMMQDRVLAYSLAPGEGRTAAKAPKPATQGKAEVAAAGGSESQASTAQVPSSAAPASPAKPAEPAKPAQPASPAKPAEPAKPAQPASSGKAAEPAKPAQPASPAKPSQPKASAGSTEKLPSAEVAGKKP